MALINGILPLPNVSNGQNVSGQLGRREPAGGSVQAVNSQNVSVNWTEVLSNTLTNEAFVTATYYYMQFVPAEAARRTPLH